MGSNAEYNGPALAAVNPAWPIMTLENICDGIFDCPHSTPKLSNDGYYMVRTQDIRQGFYDTQNSVKVSKKSYIQRTKRAKPQYGDVLLSREGTYFGDAAEVPKDIDLCLGQRMVLLRPCQKRINPTFLRIWINSKSFQNYLLAFRDGTVAERLNLSTIRKLPIPVPNIETQAEIVSLISPLEEKEALNRQMNETLEGMAQALFKSWFVDFDPVLDNALAAGNPIPDELAERSEIRRQALATGSANREAANPFPAAFQLTKKLGWIPEGWEVKELGAITTELRRGISPKYTDGDGIRVTNQRCIREHSIDYSNARRNDITKKKVDGRHLQIGDLLINSTGVGTLGRMAQVYSLDEPTVTDSHVTVVRTDPAYYMPYTFGRMMISIEPQVEAMGHGSTGQTELRRADLLVMPVIAPPSSIQKHAETLLSEWAIKSEKNNSQNGSLSGLRDTLLPKLISGELRIPDAEKLAEEALT